MFSAGFTRRSLYGTIDRVEITSADAPNGETAIGLAFHEGWLYFKNEMKDGTFSILRVRPGGGNVEAVVRGVPVQGDHDVNHLAFDRDGNLYFGVGSATNSGVVSSTDPVNQKWLKMFPAAHDIPCVTIDLSGRTFTDEEDRTGAPVVVISHGLWQRRFGGDPGVLQRTIRLGDHPYPIVGVMPPGAWTTPWLQNIDVWTPIDLRVNELSPQTRWLTAYARLKQGVTLGQAIRQLASSIGSMLVVILPA